MYWVKNTIIGFAAALILIVPSLANAEITII